KNALATVSPPVMSLVGITKAFGQPPYAVQVLHGVDLEIRTGEFTLVMGPSGSGKTTLLTIMGMLDVPSGGALSGCGHNVSRCTQAELSSIRRRHVSFIFQSFNLLSALTAAENVQVGLELHESPKGRAMQRSFDLLDRVGLAHRRHHRPAELSGGEKQRVG